MSRYVVGSDLYSAVKIGFRVSVAFSIGQEFAVLDKTINRIRISRDASLYCSFCIGRLFAGHVQPFETDVRLYPLWVEIDRLVDCLDHIGVGPSAGSEYRGS